MRDLSVSDELAPRSSVPELVAALNAAQRQLHAALSCDESGLGAAESLLLVTLLERVVPTASDLAALLGLTRGRVTHLTDQLVARGLVTRRSVGGDRRRVLIALTEAGQVAAEAAAQRSNTVRRALVRDLGAAGVDMLDQQLRVIAEVRAGLDLA